MQPYRSSSTPATQASNQVETDSGNGRDAVATVQSEARRKGIDYAIAVLAQADDIVRLVQTHPQLRYSDHIGPHLRHIVEHFGEFLTGFDRGVIDYDGRARQRDLERSPALMHGRIAEIGAALRALNEHAWPETITVAAETGLEGEEEFSCPSTPLREVLFLASHATHHYALLKQLIEARGVRLAEDFGKAPATVRFERGAGSQKAA